MQFNMLKCLGFARLGCVSIVGNLIACAFLSLGEVASAGAAHPAAREPAPNGWFKIIKLDEHTYAISEPKYWQENVSYLMIGTRRALLFDTGPGVYGIRAVVRALTKLPLVVVPSHLHFDHVGDVEEFDDVRLLDTPALRAQVRNGRFVEPAPQYMLRNQKQYVVHGWIKDGQTLDLGKRKVQIISTPGHTPDSVTVIDDGAERVFTGDLVNRIVTLCDVPGSDATQMARSITRLLALAPAAGHAYEAHSEKPLERPELEQLATGIAKIADGTATPSAMCLGGMPMRRYDIGAFAVVLPVTAGGTLAPLGSVTETLDWQGGECVAPRQP